MVQTSLFSSRFIFELQVIYRQIGFSRPTHIAISDDSLVYVYRKTHSALPSNGHSSISYRNFRNFVRENFRNEISQQDWSFG